MFPVIAPDRPFPKYLSQRDKFSCGPISVMNAHLFQGKKVSYKDLPKYRKAFKCVPKGGTPILHFVHIMKQEGFERLADPAHQCAQALADGNGLIARLEWSEDRDGIYYDLQGHPVFVGGVMTAKDVTRYLFTNVLNCRGSRDKHFWLSLDDLFEAHGGRENHMGITDVWLVPGVPAKPKKKRK